MYLKIQEHDLYQMSDDALARLETDLGPERWHSQEGRLVRMEQERRQLSRSSKARTQSGLQDLRSSREAPLPGSRDLPAVQLLGRNLTDEDRKELAAFILAVIDNRTTA